MPARLREMISCIQARDFPGFAELTMKDSNQFHATCLDTFPPISYLNDTSRRIVQLVHRFNACHGQTKVRRGRWRSCDPCCSRARTAPAWCRLCGPPAGRLAPRVTGSLPLPEWQAEGTVSWRWAMLLFLGLKGLPRLLDTHVPCRWRVGGMGPV